MNTNENLMTSVAVVCANGFGDALVQMVLASNLARQGLAVTFFNDIAAPLQRYVSEYRIKRFPAYEQLLNELQSFDVCLYDSSGTYVRGMPPEVEMWCQQNAICYRMSDASPRHRAITVEQIEKRLDSSPVSAEKFKRLNASLRGKYYTLYRPPVVQQLTEFLSEQVGLVKVTNGNGLDLPSDRTGASKRVLIHPTSSSDKKNWPAQNYIELAQRIKQLGYDPIITVSPVERRDWQELATGVCDVPQFDDVARLAEFYSGSLCFIGNDSGNAHLASSLGVPTIQLFRGWKKTPAWRAGWANNTALIASFPYNIIKSHWYKGISVERVLDRFNHLILSGQF